MKFLFRIEAENGSRLEITNDGVTVDLDSKDGNVLQLEANWDELREAGTQAVQLVDPRGEIVRLPPPREEATSDPVFPDLKGYQVPSRLFRH